MTQTGDRYLAIDLGAESGRGVIGNIANGQLTLTQVHRFPNLPVRVGNNLFWDILRIHLEIQNAITAAHLQSPGLLGVAIDSWGVDFGLLASDGSLLGNPYHYRDERTNGMFEAAFQLMPRTQVFNLTGIQFMEFNTLYQLLAMAQANAPILRVADQALLIGELLTYMLTGEKVAEFTNATTTQAYNPTTGTWATDLLAALHIPTNLMPPVVAPGTRVGTLLDSVASSTGAHGLPVFVPAVHDTASAIAAVPLEGSNACYISSGTWSLMGVEIDSPIINAQSLAANMTNEGGVEGRFCFLKNIMGMWLLQECRRSWEQEGFHLEYAAIQGMAEQATPFRTIINPDDPGFFAPGGMPERICAYAKRTHQPVPDSRNAIIRCILESLALRYNQVLLLLEQLTGRKLDTIHIVGGGSQNALLNQFTANATGCTVIAGPVEATAAGNILVQAVAAGTLSNIAEARAVVRNSFAPQVFAPQQSSGWSDAYARFIQLSES